MTWTKLEKAGDAATLTIKLCGEAPGRLGPQVRFDGTDGQTIYMPKEHAERMLAELGYVREGRVDYALVDGETLRFSRVSPPNANDRPHWKIERVAGASPARPPKAATAPAANGEERQRAALDDIEGINTRRDRVREAYLRELTHVLTTVLPVVRKYKATGQFSVDRAVDRLIEEEARRGCL